MKKNSPFLSGLKDGMPIGLGYFAVAFGLGITASNAGLNAVQGFFMSLLNNASAGQYIGIASIKAHAPYWQLAVMILITNARYLLMSCALSQHISPSVPLRQRLLMGFGITDEVFGISISYPGLTPPNYMYGAFLTALPPWAIGTAVGIVAGNILPAQVVQALAAAIYGMFIAVVVPQCRKDKTVAVIVILSGLASCAAAVLPVIGSLSENARIIILTLVISCAAAAIRPIEVEEDEPSVPAEKEVEAR